MEDYKPNSHKFNEEQRGSVPEKKIKKVIAGSVRAKKRTGLHKFADVFIADDVDSIKSYIFEDIIVPALKDIVLDATKALLGINGQSGKNSVASKIIYRNCYDKANDRRDRGSPRARSGYSYDDVILDNRGEAEDVLSRMDELMATYGLVSVADLYDLVGITCNYTDNKYGWTDIRNASVHRVRDGYMIKLPRALPLN